MQCEVDENIMFSVIKSKHMQGTLITKSFALGTGLKLYKQASGLSLLLSGLKLSCLNLFKTAGWHSQFANLYDKHFTYMSSH